EEALAMLPGAIPAQQAALLTAMTELVEIAKRPPEDQSPLLDAWAAESKRLPALARMLVASCEKLGEVFRRSHAELRCAVVALAAERYRRAKGQWPTTSADLVAAGFLTAVPADPYDGQPLRLARIA